MSCRRTRRPAGPGSISVTSPIASSNRPSSRPLANLVRPAAPRSGAVPRSDLAEEVDALIEREPLERVDAAAVEQAARHVQVLLLGLGVAPQGDALGAGVERVRPLVDRRDPGAQHQVAPTGVVLLGLVGLHDPVGDRAGPREPRRRSPGTPAGRARSRSSRAWRGRAARRRRRRARSGAVGPARGRSSRPSCRRARVARSRAPGSPPSPRSGSPGHAGIELAAAPIGTAATGRAASRRRAARTSASRRAGSATRTRSAARSGRGCRRTAGRWRPGWRLLAEDPDLLGPEARGRRRSCRRAGRRSRRRRPPTETSCRGESRSPPCCPPTPQPNS